MYTFDVVMPKGNEKDFIDVALSLGYTEILFLSENMAYKKPLSTKIKVKSGYILHNTSELSGARKNFDYVFASADRKYFESNVDFIVGLESSDRSDSFHYRSTSLNQVHAVLSRQNNSTVVFDFNALFEESFIILGRMLQNAVLVRKYRLKHSVFSMARNPLEMRSHNILDALKKILGL